VWQGDLDKEKDAYMVERTQWEEDCAAFEVGVIFLRREWGVLLRHHH
jgi:hypothetical protein